MTSILGWKKMKGTSSIGEIREKIKGGSKPFLGK